MSSLLSLEPNPPVVRHIPEADYDRLVEADPSTAKALRTCVTCRGRKQFRWLGPDGQPADYRCDCGEQTVLYLWQLNSGLDLRYQRLSWADAKGVPQVAEKAIVEYVQDAENYIAAGVGLVMHGMRGNGKTLSATLLLKMLMGEGRKGYFTTFDRMLDRYTQGWRSEEDRAWFDRRMRNTDVLVIDDMGRESDGRLGVAQGLVDSVLRARVAADRPTILTSNRNPTELGELYSLNAMSLLAESSIIVEFTGEDYRERQRNIRLDEARQGLTRPIVLA